MVQALRLADLRFIAAAVGVSFLWLGVRGLVWRTLLQEQATFRQVFFTINEGYLLNNILPFRLGEVGRAFLLARKAGMSFWEVFSTILIERVLDLAFAAGLLMSTLAFVAEAPWARQAGAAAGGIVLIGLAALYFVASNRPWALMMVEKLGQRIPLVRRLAGDRLASFFSGLAALTDGGRFLRVILWMLLDWGIAIFQYYTLLLAFFPGAKFLWAAFALGVGALGIAAPSSPGAIGVLELSLVGALSLFRLDPSTALAFALAVHLLNYLITGLLGAYGLAQDGETLSGLYARVRRIPQNDAT